MRVFARELRVLLRAAQFIRRDKAVVLLALLAHYVGHFGAVPVGSRGVPVMHVVLQRERTHRVALLLRAADIAYLCGRGCRLGLRYAGLDGLSIIALFVVQVVEPLGPLVETQGQVLGFAEIVQGSVVVTGQRPVDAMARICLVAIITDLECAHVDDV